MQTETRQQTWTVGGKTYSDFGEAVTAQDHRLRDFLRRGGFGEEELARLPKPAIPTGLTPDGELANLDWPVSTAIDEVLAKKIRLFDASRLSSAQHDTRYLIPGVLAAGQVGGIFGPFQTLKTSLAADLLISLASGTPFLGRFPVAQSGRVLLLSGEAGLPALKSLAGRICAERGLSLESLTNFVCSPDVPNLDDPFDLLAFTELVEREKPICVVIDPAFLAFGGRSRGTGQNANGGRVGKRSRSLFDMGQRLRPLVELCESTGCALLFVHHCGQSRRTGEPLMLGDLAGSGLAEFSAQWLLVSRRRPFEIVPRQAAAGETAAGETAAGQDGAGQDGAGQDRTGHHELWLTTGNRVGHRALWELDVEQGVAGVEPTGAPPVCDALGAAQTAAIRARRWKTTLRPASSLETLTDERWVAAREDQNLRRRALAFDRQCQRTLELLAAFPDGRTARFVRDTLGMSGDRINRLLDRLIEKGLVVRLVETIVDRRRPTITYSRVRASDLSVAAIGSGAEQLDPKTYDVGTGHFVDRPESPTHVCPTFAEVRHGTAQAAKTRATRQGTPEEKSGRDTGPESGPVGTGLIGTGQVGTGLMPNERGPAHESSEPSV